MISDFNNIFWWWLVIFFLGSLSLPIIVSLFRNFWDRGYIFSKILSLVVITYLTFIYGVFKLLSFSNQTIIFTAILLLIVDVYLLSKASAFQIFKQIISQKYKIFIFEELLFFLILLAWSYVRSFSPDIEGLEKFMDWGFINSALRTTYFPPKDMWFANDYINYYYFGHLIFALLTKLSSIPSYITYNLSIATVAALTFVSGFSISSNLVHLHATSKKIKNYAKSMIIVGLVSALLLTFGGNMHTVYKITKNIIEQQGHLSLSRQAISDAAASYWYPDATRFIGFDPDVNDKTIHEFPLYSFVVADLHGHMNDIPLVLFLVAFLINHFYVIKSSSKSSSPDWKLILPFGFFLSVAYMTNAWDFAVYGLLYGIISLVYYYQNQGFIYSVIKTLISGLLIVLFWYVFSLPFSLHFTPMAEGIRVSDGHSPFYQLAVLYGGFWFMALPLFIRSIFRLFTRKQLASTDIFAFALLLTATLLVIIPELIYIKDIYIYEHRRANTMFKLVYQAFIMYSLVSAYALYRADSFLKRRPLRLAYKILFVFVFSSHMIYPYFAIKSYYGMKDYQGLYGLNFLQQQYPNNLEAINWMNQNISGQPNIIEAVGDSYTTFDQVSVATGLPTIQGWVVHEWLWRGGYDQPAARQADVELFYQAMSSDPKAKDFDPSIFAQALAVLQKYNIKYIFIGSKEYEKYPDINIQNLSEIGAKQVASFGTTYIYQID